ncbi:MAG TPA: type II toxin-antitoxin system Phd/YefM family antitoxin [Longimicrobiales bacterium]
MRKWMLEDAENRFSEVVRRAEAHDPQLMTRNGYDVVAPSVEDYARLAGPESLVDFLRNSPLAEALKEGDLDLERRRDFGRDLSDDAIAAEFEGLEARDPVRPPSAS